MKALVTDADRNPAVSIIRSLGRKGWQVTAADSERRAVGFFSRYARDRLVYPDPSSAPERYVETVVEAVNDRGIDLVVPVTDEAIHPLARARERIEGACRLAIPDAAALEVVTDKAKTLALAAELGIAVPRTRVVESAEEAREAAAALEAPYVIKPAISRLHDPDRGLIEARSVSYARSVEELEERVRALAGSKLLIQECCFGVGQGVEVLSKEGRIIAAFQHRRLAELPIWGGRSPWRESVPLDPSLYGAAARLAEALRWTGLMMVEFKGGDEAARLMEINGRVWGSLPLAVLSGVDFPGLLADMYTGNLSEDESARNLGYRVGVRAYNVELLLKWIAATLIGNRRHPYLPSPRRRAVIGALLALIDPRQKGDLRALDDPRAMAAEWLRIGRTLGRSSRKALRAMRGRRRSRPRDAGDPEPGRTTGRPLPKVIDAVLTAHLREPRSLPAHARHLFSWSTPRYERVAALAGLVDSVAPGASRWTARRFLRPRGLPLDVTRLEPIGFGSGSTVFLVETPGGERVLKVYRRTLGERRDALLGAACAYRRKYETVASWYTGLDIVPETRFLVLSGPVLGRPAVGCLQEHIAGTKRDLFRDFSDEEILRLAREEPGFREQFVLFSRRTIEEFRSRGRSADLLGEGNVVVAGDPGSSRLRLIDYGILECRKPGRSPPELSRRLAGLVSRLESLLGAVSREPGQSFSARDLLSP